MTDWPDRLKWTVHDGGPQPVPDDVFVAVVHGRITRKSMGGETVILPAGDADWLRDEHSPVREFAIINQHLIDAARVEGWRLGLEAAARLAQIRGEEWEKDEDGDLLCAIAFYRHAKAVASLDPKTIAEDTDPCA
jgi:hypothetical protein